MTFDGLVRDVQIVRATDDDIARRCKAAVEQWKYGPATAPDDRVVDSRVEVPFQVRRRRPLTAANPEPPSRGVARNLLTGGDGLELTPRVAPK